MEVKCFEQLRMRTFITWITWILILVMAFLTSAYHVEETHEKPWAPECVSGGWSGEYFYHAPARVVPFQPTTTAQIKRDFLQLFRRQFNQAHVHETPQDNVTLEAMCQSNSLNRAGIDEINDLLPKNETFNSFSDRNLLAVSKLTEMFRAAQTPEELFSVIEEQLNHHSFNQKAWYYALIGAILSHENEDITGILLPWPIDATPDLYVTHSILTRAKEGSSRPRRVSSVRSCTTAGGLLYSEVKYEPAVPAPEEPEQRRRKKKRGLQQQYGASYGDFQADPCKKEIEYNITKSEIIHESWETGWGSAGWGSTGQNQGYYGAPPPVPFYDDNNLNVWRKKRFTSKRKKRQARECLHYNGTTGATGDENLLWYFREDMFLNQHHWYWHQYYPKIGETSLERDRRGEIFLFAHHSIVARYNAERISNGLPLVTPLELREYADIGSGYFPDLIDENTGRLWTFRLPGTPLRDIVQKNDPNYGFNMRINKVANSLTILTNHVKQGYLMVNRSGEEPFPLSIVDQEGLSHLGNTVEATPRLSTNNGLYQSAHSLGHLGISVATDPDFRCNLLKGVMADVAVAMRDPAFFRVHALVDILYNKHKSTLAPYQIREGDWPLQWEGVKLHNVEVMAGEGNVPKVNDLNTFWSIRRFPLEEGIDGSIHEGDVKVDVCHQHLDHEPFMFKLVIDVDSCAKTVSNKGMVRLFMAPRKDANGRRFSMEETRHLMFQLDAFPAQLHRGRNTITRYSIDSSATKPWPRTLSQMLADPDNGNQTEYCGCGWPHHLYIPKGSPEGTEFDLFGMVTNFDHDQVLDSLESLIHPETCNMPYIYCGRPRRKYPDARPMGYPFDRAPFSVYEKRQEDMYGGGYNEPTWFWRKVRDLEEYVSHVSNMQGAVLRIRHIDRIIT